MCVCVCMCVVFWFIQFETKGQCYSIPHPPRIPHGSLESELIAYLGWAGLGRQGSED